MENNSTLEKILLMFNRNAELLRLVGATFVFQSGFSQKDDDEKFDHSEKFAEKKAIFCFICFVVVYILVVKYPLKVFETYLYAH